MTPVDAAAQNPRVQRYVWIAVIALVVLIGLANAHLVYVAVSTQPDCVAPVQNRVDGSAVGGFRAAKPAC